MNESTPEDSKQTTPEAGNVVSTKEANDDQANQKLTGDVEQINTSSSEEDSSTDGTLPVEENKASATTTSTSYGTCRNMVLIFAVMFLALCAGAVLKFFVFDDTSTKSKSAASYATEAPTGSPSMSPTMFPTVSSVPTVSNAPTKEPSGQPSSSPTISNAPSSGPTIQPSGYPSSTPTDAPSNGPSIQPSNSPTISNAPSSTPSYQPSSHPTIAPSSLPTVSQSPTKAPSRTPTRFPTIAPSDSPTRTPTRRPTPSPTLSPSAAPTVPPEILYEANLRKYLENDFGVRIRSANDDRAISRIVEEAKENGFNDMSMSPKLAQRYALINMESSLFGNNVDKWGSFKQDECTWTGIACNSKQEVTHIRLMGKKLQGTIPTEIGLLNALEHLDLAHNALMGSLPEQLYNCVKLKKIHLYHNRLSGTISDKIIKLWELEEFNLSSNLLKGPIPRTMRSNDRGIYRIRYFNVYDNQMTGSFPAEGSNLRQLFYMDLGRNRFSGTIPPMDDYVRLRHLYLDHNEFTGQLPQNIVNTGDNRLELLAVNDNLFTGKLPGQHTFITELKQFTAQNNRFTSMTERTCQLSVMEFGESAEFRSDCNICACGKNDVFCKYCYN